MRRQDKAGGNMSIKRTIKKYIYIIISLILLIANGLILKVCDGGYVRLSGNLQTFYLIMIILVISPIVSLIVEIIGLKKAVSSYRQIDENEPYSVKRKGIRYMSLVAGGLLLTIVWLCAVTYITYRYLFG